MPGIIPKTPLELLAYNLIEHGEVYCNSRSSFTHCKGAISLLISFIGIDESKYNLNNKTFQQIETFIEKTCIPEIEKDEGMFRTVRLGDELKEIMARWKTHYAETLKNIQSGSKSAANADIKADAKRPSPAPLTTTAQSDEIAKLKEQLAAAEKARKELEDQKKAADGKLAAAETEKANLEKQKRAADEKVSEMTMANSALQAELKEKNDRLAAALEQQAASLKTATEAQAKALDAVAKLQAPPKLDDKLETSSTASKTSSYQDVVRELCSPKRFEIFCDVIKAYDVPLVKDEKAADKKALQDLHDALLSHTAEKAKRDIKTDDIIETWKKSSSVSDKTKIIEIVQGIKNMHDSLSDEMPVLSDDRFKTLIGNVRNALKKDLSNRNFIIPNRTLSEKIKSSSTHSQPGRSRSGSISSLSGFAAPTPRGAGSKRPSVVAANAAAGLAAAASQSQSATAVTTAAAVHTLTLP